MTNCMKKIVVFDPPLCCPTGICGPSVDPKLTRFAADLDWLKKKGLPWSASTWPSSRALSPPMKPCAPNWPQKGNDCLPLIILDGVIVAAAFISIARNWPHWPALNMRLQRRTRRPAPRVDPAHGRCRRLLSVAGW
jgi:hypothetical protein